MQFSDQLWQAIIPIYQNIIAHSFIQELGTGKLAQERFTHYLQQDALYLVDYAKALAMTAVKADKQQHFLNCLDFAKGAAVAEMSLHQHFFKLFSIPMQSEKSLSCLAYTQFLLATAALESYPEALAALLPCFWIYREVGRYIQSIATDNNPYQLWINTYTGDEFDQAVETAIAMVNEVSLEASALSLQRMQQVFIISSQLEYAFWDAHSTSKCDSVKHQKRTPHVRVYFS